MITIKTSLLSISPYTSPDIGHQVVVFSFVGIIIAGRAVIIVNMACVQNCAPASGLDLVNFNPKDRVVCNLFLALDT